jgi:hypothetical protein
MRKRFSLWAVYQREFVFELAARLDRFTHDELKSVILEHAASLLPEKRQAYLDIFDLPIKPEPEKMQKAEGDSLLRDIEAFGKRAGHSGLLRPFPSSCFITLISPLNMDILLSSLLSSDSFLILTAIIVPDSIESVPFFVGRLVDAGI